MRPAGHGALSFPENVPLLAGHFVLQNKTLSPESFLRFITGTHFSGAAGFPSQVHVRFRC